jgi:hypothetical protein
MSARRYANILGNVSPSARGVSRAADIVAALAPPPSGSSTALVPQSPRPTTKEIALDVLPGLGGGVVGALSWKRHRVLGFLLGHALAATAVPLYRGHGNERKRALCQLGVEGAGIGGALLWKDHPVLGWIGGIMLGTGVTMLIPGSPANTGYARLHADLNAPLEPRG